jgi:hypothetical protein
MGYYKLHLGFVKYQFGLCVEWDNNIKGLAINLPFIRLTVVFKNAHGAWIFGKLYDF